MARRGAFDWMKPFWTAHEPRIPGRLHYESVRRVSSVKIAALSQKKLLRQLHILATRGFLRVSNRGNTLVSRPAARAQHSSDRSTFSAEDPGNLLFSSTSSKDPGNLLFSSTSSKDPGNLLFSSTSSKDPGNLLISSTSSKDPGNLLFGSTSSKDPGNLLFPAVQTSSKDPGNLLFPAVQTSRFSFSLVLQVAATSRSRACPPTSAYPRTSPQK
jgi:hypothetical protein